jgi:hypothetical protein
VVPEAKTGFPTGLTLAGRGLLSADECEGPTHRSRNAARPINLYPSFPAAITSWRRLKSEQYALRLAEQPDRCSLHHIYLSERRESRRQRLPRDALSQSPGGDGRLSASHLSCAYQVPWRSIVSLDGWTSSVIENIFILKALQLPSGLLYIPH